MATTRTTVAYCQLDFPWWIRPGLRHLAWWTKKLTEDGQGEYVQRWKVVDAGVPERKGVMVRLKHNEGTWQVTSRGENKTHIVYKFSVDPGGSIPDWLASFGQKDGVMDTLDAWRSGRRS